MGTGYDEEFTAWAATRAVQLRRTAFLMCGDWHLADDLAQTTLVRIYAAWPRLNRRDALDSYARRTLVHALVDEGRRPWRREHGTDAVPEPRSAVDGHDDGAVGDRVAGDLAALQILASLPPRQRAAMVLRYWEDLPVEQVADVLGVSVGTVKSQTHKAARAVRAELERESTEVLR